LIRLIRALVDTAALRHNLGTIRAYAPGAKVMAVVKANAYGHGLVATALALADADSFAVARLEEGMALRAAGVRACSAPSSLPRPRIIASSSWFTIPCRSNYSRHIATRAVSSSGSRSTPA
jgi:alanine racemase